MKATLTILLCAVAAGAAAQTADHDSIDANELGEITVVATMQRTDATKTVYIPMARQREAASDGVSLLDRMNIPQLSVNPVSLTVTTASGEGVGFFINSRQVSKEDVAGLNPADVKRVEYLEYPVDPRFMRTPYAVNFVLHDYQYGGYTKVHAKNRFCVSSGEAELYSKYSFRQMEYDFMASGAYDNNRHAGSDSRETFHLPDATIKRNETMASAKHRRHDRFIGLRASWARQSFSWRHLVSLSSSHRRHDSASGLVTFSGRYPDSEYSASSPGWQTSAGYSSDIYASLAHGWAINGEYELQYNDNRADNTYRSAATSISTRARERGWYTRGSVQADKTLSDKLTLFANLRCGGGRTDTQYTGTDVASNRFGSLFAGVTAGVNLNLGKVAGSVDGGYAFETNRINTERMDDGYPFAHISMQCAPDSRNSINLFAQYATFSPDASMKSPNMIRRNELLYVSGNPALDYARNVSAAVNYTLLPSDRWQLTAYATVFKIINRQAPVYLPDGPSGAMLKQYQNDGDYNHGQIGANATGKFFGNSLSVSISPRLLLYRITGTNAVSAYPFTVSLKAGYYIRNFFFSAYWSLPLSYVDGETCMLSRLRSEYSLSAGWSARGWNIELSAANIFRSSWRTGCDSLTTPYYSGLTTRFGPEYHRRISLSVTYTINYGRRLAPSQEIQNQGASTSTILH